MYDMYDATIVGGGPAGLSAALMLGRARRRVLLCDTGEPRNAASHAMHGFLSRDGSDPAELLRVGRAQLRPYDCIDVRDTAVVQASGAAGRFTLTLDGGERLDARRLVLAFGVKDQLPDIEGLRTLWGRGVFPCPYCDGWEVRDQPLAAARLGETASRAQRRDPAQRALGRRRRLYFARRRRNSHSLSSRARRCPS